MVDFAVLPPEINSARMYTGPGSKSMVAAATAWGGLAAELTSATTTYRAVLDELTSGPWLGPVSTTMAAAAAPYLTWMSTTATQAALTASQASAAAAAHEAAFAATVPPPLIAENRALFALLVVTDLFGQNAAAIATAEAQYAEMWAQDAAAMYGYASSSAAATRLTRFGSPPNISNPAGVSAQGAAVAQATGTSSATQATSVLSQVISAVPNALQGLSSGAAVDPVAGLESLLNTPTASSLNTLLGVTGTHLSNLSGPLFTASVTPFFLAPLMPLALPATAASEVSAVSGDALGSTLASSDGTAAGAAGLGIPSASADMGEATSVGELSVPQSWSAAAPEIRLAATALPAAGLGGTAAPPAGSGGWFGGMPLVASVVNAPRHSGARSRSAAAGEPAAARPEQPRVGGDKPGRWVPGEQPTQTDTAPLTTRERDELDAMRKELAELAMERDAAARLIREAIQP